MEKLPMCRICLVENVRMYAVVEKNIQDVYESLTHFSFITEDSRPTLACVFCYAKLKQCCQLQRQCLQAEQLFAQMINEAYPSINQDQSKVFNAFVKTEVVNISIDGVVQMEHVAIKEEVPVYYEGPEDIIEPKEEPHSDANDCSDVEETPVQHFESKKNMMEIKREVKQEHGGSEEERKASDMRWASAAENPQEDIKNIKVEDDVNTHAGAETYV
ncbi:hypothetical protein PYW07_012542 [Mythimna separata]|uniref:ZAD domain-containing protein n=1 Tax=Mythimna separata TaxID=271217 RepID=A0AAD7Y8N8_MYTSE|nr:hypothetical protein PYW07_012542 [Mythimna separata]